VNDYINPLAELVEMASTEPVVVLVNGGVEFRWLSGVEANLTSFVSIHPVPLLTLRLIWTNQMTL